MMKDFSIGCHFAPFHWRLFSWWGWGWGEFQLGPLVFTAGWPVRGEE